MKSRSIRIFCAVLFCAMILQFPLPANAEPLAVTIIPNATTVVCGASIQWKTRVADAVGEVSYIYALSRDGKLILTETSGFAAYHIDSAVEGTYELTVTVTDSKGNASGAVKSAPVEVTATCQKIILDKKSVTLQCGQKLMPVNVTFEPACAKPELIWSTSAMGCVDLNSQTGEVLGLCKGGQTIYVRAVGSTASASYSVNVEFSTGYVKSMMLNYTKATGLVGKKLQLRARLNPDDIPDPNILWTTSDYSVARVSDKGLVTAVGAGKAVITAHASAGVTAQCEITVRQEAAKAVSQVKLNRTSAVGVVDAKLQLSAAVSPENASNRKLQWETSNAAVATVDASGLVTAVGKGACWIRAMAQDGSGKYALCRITIVGEAVKVTGVRLNRENARGVPGGKLQLKATVTPGNAGNRALLWESSNESVATVSDEGLVRAVGEGACWVRAKAMDDSGEYALCKITIVGADKSVSGIRLNYTSATGMPGKKLQLKATVSPENAYNKEVLWQTNNAQVATVDADGRVTAVSVGECLIRAIAQDGSGKYALCRIRVVGAEKAASKIVLNQIEAVGIQGGKMRLYATVTPADAKNRAVIWETSNTAVATVDQNGLVTAVGKGSCYIRAKAQSDYGVYALCAIKVR